MDFTGQKITPYIADILHQHGIEQVIICPGSRNAPLTLAFVRHGKFNCLSIIDERSVGYFALGLAQATAKTVAVICTSGTAVLNLAPAIAEAYYQQVSLLILTADRPEAWINQQDGQAIQQKNIYTNFIAASYHLKGEMYHQDDVWFTERTINEACHITQQQKRPVHINVSFAEPLYDDSYKKVDANKIELYTANNYFSYWNKLLAGKKKILIVIGQISADVRVQQAAKKIHSNNGVILAEDLANIINEDYISNATEVVTLNAKELVPDVVIYFGGAIVSKQLKNFIRNTNAPVIRVQVNTDEVDTFRNNVSLVQQTVADGLETLADYFIENEPSKNYFHFWKNSSGEKVKQRDHFIKEAHFSDLKVFDWVSKNIPENSILHFANSTPVRYGQIFNNQYPITTQFYSNRGTSGIDGSTSTAVGFSYGNSQLHFLITGDISFQYDSNAFFNKYLKGNLKIIIINNSGGNIFKVIDGPRNQKECADFFETSTHHEFSNLAKHFNLNYFSAKDEKELTNVWSDFIQLNNRPSVLEVFTGAELSANTFKEFYKYLQQK